MPASVTASGTGRAYSTQTITLSGHAANTQYVVSIKHGFGTQNLVVTTDGSGNATTSWVPQHTEMPTITTRPLAETNGSTPAAATATTTTAK